MNDERDPVLESLFVQAEQDLVDDGYTAQVMAKVANRHRNVTIGRFVIVLVIVIFEFLLSAPLQDSVGVLTQVLSTTLVQLENEWMALALAPLNSIAGLIGMTFLGVHILYRRMVR